MYRNYIQKLKVQSWKRKMTCNTNMAHSEGHNLTIVSCGHFASISSFLREEDLVTHSQQSGQFNLNRATFVCLASFGACIVCTTLIGCFNCKVVTLVYLV